MILEMRKFLEKLTKGEPNIKPNSRHFTNPPRIQDFIERRKTQLRSLNLDLGVVDSIIQEDINLLHNITEIDNINKLILRLYDLDQEHIVTEPVGVLDDFGVEGLYKMNASINNHDCLMHSFLTSTCENFRRLNQHFKDEFANFFRRTVFLSLPVVQCFMRYNPVEGKKMEKRILSTDFLHEYELYLLVAQFRVNILAAQGEDDVNLFQRVNRDALHLRLPGECIPQENFRTTIAIYTSGAHFESLRDAEGYIFSDKKVNNFLRINDANNGENANLQRGLEASMGIAPRPSSLAHGYRPSSVSLHNENVNLQRALEASRIKPFSVVRSNRPSSVAYANENENVQRAIKASLMPPAKGNPFSDNWICAVCDTENSSEKQKCYRCGARRLRRGGRRTRKGRRRSSRGTRGRISHP